MMNLRQDPKVAVQSHPGQRQQADQKLGKSKHQWNVFNLTLSFALYWTAIHRTQALTFRSQPRDTAVSRGAVSKNNTIHNPPHRKGLVPYSYRTISKSGISYIFIFFYLSTTY